MHEFIRKGLVYGVIILALVAVIGFIVLILTPPK
jgi:hypothetical protein